MPNPSTFTAAATSNDAGSLTALRTFVAGGLQAPIITSPPETHVTQGQATTYQIMATSSPNSYGASGLPAGASVNTATGVISIPATLTVGSYPTDVSATNAGGTGVMRLNIVVDAVPPANPLISSRAKRAFVFAHRFGLR